ncbi:hypothetical protein GCM10028895_18260 [Pontibacter rugosus]
MITAYDQPALGGVYKLAAIKAETGDWKYKIKLSEQLVKTSNPGMLQVRRFYNQERNLADMIYNELEPLPDQVQVVHPLDSTRRKSITSDTAYRDLLISVFTKGKLVYTLPDLQSIKSNTKQEISRLHESIRRYVNPHSYPAGLEEKLHQHKMEMILTLRGTK